MKKRFIAVLLVVTLGSIGTTYGQWNKKLTVQMKYSTGSFDFRFSGEDQAAATIVNRDNQVLDEIDGVEMEISQDQKDAELLFTKNLPIEQLMNGEYIRIQYPLTWEEGTVFPKTQEKPDFDEPSAQVAMAGEVKGLCSDGNLYEYSGDDGEFLLDFDLFYRVDWEDDILYGYIYLALADEAIEMMNSLSEVILEFEPEELTLADYEVELTEDQQGLVVEYSGRFSIYFDQMNESVPHGNGD